MEDSILLQSYDTEAIARVVESKLKSEGLEVQLTGSHAIAAGPVPGLFQLFVREPDFKKAVQILSQTE